MSSTAAKERGNKFYRDGNYSAAIDEYSTAIDLASSNDMDLHITYSNRCACYMKLNKFNSALEDAQACISLKPTWSKGYSRLGNCLIRLNRPSEAIYPLERALELDPENEDVKVNLAQARSLLDGGSSRSQSTSSSSTRTNFNNQNSNANTNNNNNNSYNSNNNNNPNNHNQYQYAHDDGFAGGGTDWVAKVKSFLTDALARASMWWASLDDNTRNIIMLCVGGFIVYRLFFSGSRGYSSYDDYYSGYGGYGGYGYGGGGMSWTMWIAIMVGAWKLPPMFPDQLGQYALPFFGMNWTTFMWLLNMFSRNRGGYGMYGGGFGRPYGGYGGYGMHNRRGRFF